MFEFICDRIIPGCTHKDEDEKQEELLERAMIHFREHHTMEHRYSPLEDTLRTTGIVNIRPL